MWAGIFKAAVVAYDAWYGSNILRMDSSVKDLLYIAEVLEFLGGRNDSDL